MSRKKRLLILCPYPLGTAPSQRFRIEPYLDDFHRAGFEVQVAPFLDRKAWDVLYRPGHLVSKAAGVLRGFFRRCADVVKVFRADVIFLHREACPVGPPLFECLLFALRKKVVFDFDDAIFLSPKSRSNRLLSWLRWTNKTQYIATHAYGVAACNPYLVSWSAKFNRNVQLIPTVIDPQRHRPLPKPPSGKPIVGWTGSHSTMAYLDIVRPALQELQKRFEFEFRVICDVDPGFPELRSYRFLPWRLETEIEDLNEFDIGLMPVPDGTWERGKVGFKAIQYSAMAIVPVASAVGSGPEVVEHGVTGLLVENTNGAWMNALEQLISQPTLIPTMGARARERILRKYSADAVAPMLIGMLD